MALRTELEGENTRVELPPGDTCNEAISYIIELRVATGDIETSEAITVSVHHVCPQ
jgi:hypothetical protein